jgi:phosphohistidine phosphatase
MTPSRVGSLFLVRHAIAEERGPAWPDDSRRPLTHRGKARMRQVVAGLVHAGVRLDKVYTSPLVRAAETADLLVRGWTPRPELSVCAALAPGQPVDAIRKVLAGGGRGRAIALVGHEPGLGELAAWLVGAAEPLPFKKGGVCRIDVAVLPPEGVGQLIWHAPPKMLRR